MGSLIIICYLKNKCSEKVSLSKDDLKVKPLYTSSDLKTRLKIIIECLLCIMAREDILFTRRAVPCSTVCLLK